MTTKVENPNFSIYLRALQMEDARTIWRWHNSEELYRNLLGECHRPEFKRTELWLRDQIAPSPNRFSFAICESDFDRHIGNLYLREVDRNSGSAEFHVFIGDVENRGKGYGRQSLQLLLTHAFGQLELRRIYLKVLADNTSAIRVYSQCGFLEEGRLLKHVKKAGVYKDVIIMGINKES
jgi:RimJ/RimL family protein N-acetyltransferase